MKLLAKAQLPLAPFLIGIQLLVTVGSIAGGVRAFSVDDPTVSAGVPIRLTWELEPGYDTVSIGPGIGDVSGMTVGGVGSILISPGPAVTTNYTLNIDGPAGAESASVTVAVGPPPEIREFLATIDLANPRTRRILSWDVVGAADLEISPGVGRVPVSGHGFYEIVASTAEWSFLDDGSDQGAAWVTVDFDDSHWRSGPAELGYGERDEATVVDTGGPGSDKAITTYFRRSFSRTAADVIEGLRLGIRYDDGAVVYLNGAEIGRFYMPAGIIDYKTPALGDVPGDSNNYEFLDLPAIQLREGRNVFAVEVHQSRPGSSDMSFAMKLEGIMDGGLAVVPPGNTTYTLTASNDFGSVATEVDVLVSVKPLVAYGFDAEVMADLTGSTVATAVGATPPSFLAGSGRHGDGSCDFGGDGGIRISGGDGLSGLAACPVGDPLSVALWIRADAALAGDAVVLDGGIGLSKAEGDDPTAMCVELPGGQELTIRGVFDGGWHHVAITAMTGTSAQPGNLNVYIDGLLVRATNLIRGGWDLPPDWVLGQASDGDDSLVGRIDDFAVFDRALTQAEIDQLVDEAAVSFLIPRVLQFEVDDPTLAPGAEATLSWVAVDAEGVTIDPDPGPVDGLGEVNVRPHETTTYVLTASNAHGEATRELTITTGPVPVIRRWVVSPDVVPAGGATPATLSWDVGGSTSVTIDRGIGVVGEQGSRTIAPTSFASYRLVAENEFGINAAVATATVVDEPSDRPWTMVIIPDTQHYSDNPANAPIFTQITNWIVANRHSRNIRFVLHEGDVVEHNTTVEWDRAMESLGVLDGVVPYAVTTGNHDLGPNGNASTRDGEFNLATRFGAGSPYANQPTMGGYYEGTGDPSYRESTYHTFHAGGIDYLVLALEWSPRDGVVEWATRIVEEHPGHRAILLTHMYLNAGGSRWIGGVGIGENNGAQLWEKLVRPYENFFMTANGHALSLGYLASTTDQGNLVHQMLFNAQGEANGGDGWIRLLEFAPDGNTVQVTTFSPYREAQGLSAWRTDPANQFTLALSPFPAADADGDQIPDGWERSHGLDPTDPTDALFDPNGNGMNNFMEYATAGRPTAVSSRSDVEPVAAGVVEGRVLISFRRRISFPETLGYVIERSNDLQLWISDPGDGSVFSEVSVENAGDGTERVVVEDVQTGGGPDATVYYRLRITAPAE